MQISINDVKMYLGEQIAIDDVMPALTDEEIVFSMKRQQAAYNDLGPTSIRINWQNLPDDSNIFFDGCQWIICKSRLAKYLRGDISYNAGGVTVEVTKTAQQNIGSLQEQFKKDFMEQQQMRKLSCSYQRQYGAVNQTQEPFLHY